MKKTHSLLPCGLLCLSLIVLAGCHATAGSSADQEAKMRASFKQEGKPVELNKLPPEARDKVQGYMNMSKNAKSAKDMVGAPAKSR